MLNKKVVTSLVATSRNPGITFIALFCGASLALSCAFRLKGKKCVGAKNWLACNAFIICHGSLKDLYNPPNQYFIIQNAAKMRRHGTVLTVLMPKFAQQSVTKRSTFSVLTTDTASTMTSYAMGMWRVWTILSKLSCSLNLDACSVDNWTSFIGTSSVMTVLMRLTATPAHQKMDLGFPQGQIPNGTWTTFLASTATQTPPSVQLGGMIASIICYISCV